MAASPKKGKITAVNPRPQIAYQTWSVVVFPISRGKIKLPAPKNIENKARPTVRALVFVWGDENSCRGIVFLSSVGQREILDKGLSLDVTKYKFLKNKRWYFFRIKINSLQRSEIDFKIIGSLKQLPIGSFKER